MISIVVPIYNGEDYISSFTESCKNQIYHDFEIIFVNDGSSDNSLEKLVSLRQESQLVIKIINQKNQGVSSARNEGIKLATGEYICFCDIDDEISSKYLSEMLTQIKKNSVDLVVCKMKFIKQISRKFDKIKQLENTENKTYEVQVLSQIEALEKYLFSEFQSGCCNILVRRNILLDNAIGFPLGYKYNEDIYTLWKILSCVNSIALIDIELYYYKQRHDSAMSKFDNNRLDGLTLMKSLEPFFKNNNPQFYNKYKRYGASRIAWSLLWQSAIFMNYIDYREFSKQIKFKLYCKNLITYPQLRVSLSAALFFISPSLFRYMSIKLKPYRYKQ